MTPPAGSSSAASLGSTSNPGAPRPCRAADFIILNTQFLVFNTQLLVLTHSFSFLMQDSSFCTHVMHTVDEDPDRFVKARVERRYSLCASAYWPPKVNHTHDQNSIKPTGSNSDKQQSSNSRSKTDRKPPIEDRKSIENRTGSPLQSIVETFNDVGGLVFRVIVLLIG